MKTFPKLVWVLLGLLIVLQIITVIVAIHSPQGKSYPITQVVYKTGLQGPIGLTGDQGHPGISIQGVSGVPGIQGPTGPQGTQGLTGATGEAGIMGLKGEAGPSGVSVELRINPITLSLECRLAGDTYWTPITNTGNVCP